MVKYREILRQRAMGISIRNIAFSCGCSTATVVTVVDRAKARGLEWPLPEEMNDAAIRAVIYPREPKSDASKAEIDHERVDREMERPGVTLMVLWSEYCDAALASGKEPYMYSACCQRHRKWAMANKVAMHIERKPAQEMQVDYVGDTMGVLDLDTGELLKVYVFAACLPYSGELYAEGFYDMKEESWVEAHVHAFSFYGGSVPIIVPDNLKQGVARNTVEELVVNEQYRRMAEHYGCAIVPAPPPAAPRPRGAGPPAGVSRSPASVREKASAVVITPRCRATRAPGRLSIHAVGYRKNTGDRQTPPARQSTIMTVSGGCLCPSGLLNT